MVGFLACRRSLCHLREGFMAHLLDHTSQGSYLTISVKVPRDCTMSRALGLCVSEKVQQRSHRQGLIGLELASAAPVQP